jgi:hypothetical protein
MPYLSCSRGHYRESGPVSVDNLRDIPVPATETIASQFGGGLR